MILKAGTKAVHEFDQPLDLICDCHRRIEHHLEVMMVIAEMVRGQKLTPSHRHALETSLDYFLHRAPRHRADEEDSLFPRLAMHPDQRAQEARETLKTLLAEHVASNAYHDEVNGLVRTWLDRDGLTAGEMERLNKALTWLSEMYQRHISVEGACVLRTARECLEKKDLAQMGREMAARRGVKRAGECGDF